jgi:hypothetical protein
LEESGDRQTGSFVSQKQTKDWSRLTPRTRNGVSEQQEELISRNHGLESI